MAQIVIIFEFEFHENKPNILNIIIIIASDQKIYSKVKEDQ